MNEHRDLPARPPRFDTALITPAQAYQLYEHQERNPHRVAAVKFIDASWHMPNSSPSRDACVEYQREHIPNAKWWDPDRVAAMPDSENLNPLKLPHMMPTLPKFIQAKYDRHIDDTTTVVVYDTHGVFSSPRTWLTFKQYQHEHVHVLDGGFPRWIAEGYPVSQGLAEDLRVANRSRAIHPTQSLVKSYEEVIAIQQQKDNATRPLILDARPNGRFTGFDPEPRKGMSSGHMPTSLSLPFSALLTQSTQTMPPYKTMLPKDKLRAAFIKTLGSEEALESVLKGEREVVATCGSGMTACIIYLALWELGARKLAIYDESWMGYAQRPDAPIIKSA